MTIYSKSSWPDFPANPRPWRIDWLVVAGWIGIPVLGWSGLFAWAMWYWR